jgi:RsmE family RNA methyltransferase
MRFIFLEKLGGQLQLDRKDVSHLKVLRKSPPFKILGLYEEAVYQCVITGELGRYVLKESHFIKLITKSQRTVFFPLIETRRLEWAVEKLSELCIGKIQFYFSDHSTWTKTGIERFESRIPRLNEKVRSACQQSGNMSIPEIRSPIPLQTIFKQWGQNELGSSFLALGVKAAKPLDITQDLLGIKNFIVGPEGDFSRREYELMKDQSCALRRFSRPEILRSETALVAMATLFFCANQSPQESFHVPNG